MNALLFSFFLCLLLVYPARPTLGASNTLDHRALFVQQRAVFSLVRSAADDLVTDVDPVCGAILPTCEPLSR
ncbi:hypothetical protein E2C01_030589 [Portunus trituberculatus]|uniref:Uncharacterized protein n=1 Tax=Portunus trituberculatus TaxID=210409 RepID=A0A5B7EXR0_PORTR|nr:hypothetical protein [Portunus trituberculatus]